VSVLSIEEQLAVIEAPDATLARAIEMARETLLAQRQLLDRAEHERDEYRKLYQMLLEENERLKRGLLGQKAERLHKDDAQQLSLAVLGMMLGQEPKPAPAAPTKTVKEHERRRPTGRKGLPDSLPEVFIELLPEEVKRQGLDAFERIGEQESVVLERRPQSLVRVRVSRPKFVPRDRKRNESTQVLIHEPAELPIERGSAGPGMLADTIVRRWDDHAPLNRL
jgi:transposase